MIAEELRYMVKRHMIAREGAVDYTRLEEQFEEKLNKGNKKPRRKNETKRNNRGIKTTR